MSAERSRNGGNEVAPRASTDTIDPEKIRREVEVEFYRASGPGGQRRNKVETAVRMRHPPSGVVVTASEERSQARNREIAFERLLERLRRLARRRRRRVATRKPAAVRAREVDEKKRAGDKKRLRARVRRRYEPED